MLVFNVKLPLSSLPMLKLLSSKAQGCKDFWKPCRVGIHCQALIEYVYTESCHELISLTNTWVCLAWSGNNSCCAESLHQHTLPEDQDVSWQIARKKWPLPLSPSTGLLWLYSWVGNPGISVAWFPGRGLAAMCPACHLDTQNTVFWQFGHAKVNVRICWRWLFLEDRKCRSCSVTFIKHTKQYLA